jgi:cell division GTPase FtsZ
MTDETKDGPDKPEVFGGEGELFPTKSSGAKSGPEKPEQYKEIFAASIPDLPLEDFEPDIEAVVDEIEDKANGALTYAFVGAGQGGGRMAKAFYELGYTKTLAVNTAKNDLNLLDMPEEHKFYIDHYGDQGAGKDQVKAAIAFEAREQEVFNKLKSIIGENVDRIIICAGVAGGSGGGSVVPLIKLCKKYFTYVGKEDASERIGVIASLPTTGESASPVVAKNAYNRMKQLCAMAKENKISPLIIVDNQKIKKLYPKLTVKAFWPTINNTVAGLFHIFNVLATQNSDYTSFDPQDYDSVMKSSGCMIMGVTAVKDFESETGVSTALKANLETTLLAEGFDLKTATAAAGVVVGGTQIFEETAGLMDNLEHAFSTLAAITGNAMVHRGIYEDPSKDKLVVYTLIGGLDAPQKRLEDLTKFMKLDPYGDE